MRRVFTVAIAVCMVLTTTDADAKRKRRKRKRAAPVPALTKNGLPNVQAAAAIVVDVNSTEELYAKNADKVRKIASTGKIFIAMLVRNRNIDLTALTKMKKIDLRYAKGGARSRLRIGHKFRNLDLLRAMLIASDNRACTALGRAIGLSPKQLVREMNKLAKQMGLAKTRFTNPSGLRGNVSTARELAKSMHKAMLDPLLAKIMGTREITIRSVHKKRPRAITYRNTNVSLRTARHRVTAGKTGFTRAAGYCLLITAELKGRELAMVFLGTKGKLTRFADFNRVAGWMLRRRGKTPRM